MHIFFIVMTPLEDREAAMPTERTVAKDKPRLDEVPE
jgi:hypothetical protein